jgi:hypothetical protein
VKIIIKKNQKNGVPVYVDAKLPDTLTSRDTSKSPTIIIKKLTNKK